MNKEECFSLGTKIVKLFETNGWKNESMTESFLDNFLDQQ